MSIVTGTWLRGSALTGILLLSLASDAQSAISRGERGLVGGKTSLELGGSHAGWVWNAFGGGATADVVSEPAGQDRIVRKHLGQPRYEDITFGVGTGMTRAFYNTVKGAVDGTMTRSSGAIVMTDFDYKEQSRLTFSNALLTEVAFPMVDANSKDAAKMLITFSPESTRNAAGSGQRSSQQTTADAKVQKKWLSSNFRMTIDGIDTSRVSKVESFVVKTSTVRSPTGEMRDSVKEAGKLDYSNLVVYVAESGAKSFQEWHEQFVVKGANDQGKEKSGRLEFLGPDLKTPFFSLDFKGLGIIRAEFEPVGVGDAVRRMRVEMYVESAKFNADPSSAIEK